MHGTGTPLGDPIEVGAAAAVFQGKIIVGCIHQCHTVVFDATPATSVLLGSPFQATSVASACHSAGQHPTFASPAQALYT